MLIPLTTLIKINYEEWHMIGHVVSGQSACAPDAYLALRYQKKGETPTQAFLKVWFSRGIYRTDIWKEMLSKATENPSSVQQLSARALKTDGLSLILTLLLTPCVV